VLTVIEADGSLIEPYTTTRLSIAPGQRYSVLVETDKARSQGNTFWIRSEMDYECLNMPNPNLDYQAKAIVQYVEDQHPQTQPESSERTVVPPKYDLELRTKVSKRSFGLRSEQLVLPQTQAWPRKEGEEPCHDEQAKQLRPLRIAAQGAPPAPKLDLASGDKREAITVTMPKLDRNGLVPVSWINRTQWTAPSVPLLRSFALAPGTTTANETDLAPSPYDPAHQVVLSPSSADPVTLELIINNKDEAPHPFHLHGHKFHVMVLSESNVGFGTYNPEGPNDDAEWFDEYTAPYRDTVSVPRRGFAILRWKTDNPGVWAMHCHVLVHMQTGMALAIIDQADKIGQLGFAKGLLDRNGGEGERWEAAKCPSHLAAAA
jgi:FtsP/CotA-like multicopper oxidase with cupredoxin domain